MTKGTIIIAAFVAGIAAGVAGDRWLGAPEWTPQTAEERFTVDPAWWPSPPRCPPFSTIQPPVARAL